MNYEPRTNKAFTLIELLVAVAILTMVLAIAGVIFRVSAGSYQTAAANTEVMQKLRAITDQLNADFKGLRKDGEIFIAWAATPADFLLDRDDPDGFVRLDRVTFFADGDFQSYGANPRVIRGNLARISYMLAKRGNSKPEQQPREKRILARTQHILTADSNLVTVDPNTFSTDQQWYNWHNLLEYDKTNLDGWKNIPWQQKQNMLSVITDVKVGNPTVNGTVWGANVNPSNPGSIHILFCEGVGEFEIQGWYYDQSRGIYRWVPEVDINGDGLPLSQADSDFLLIANKPDPDNIPGVLYPYPPYGNVNIYNINYSQPLVNEDNFYRIPGLGRALKFTFTLYDSKGVIKKGRTFTHIVYLDN